ncbi:hypothetical protein I2900191A2_18840 [Intestinibacter bartlettii]
MNKCRKCNYTFNIKTKYKKIIKCPKCNSQYEKVNDKSTKKSVGLSTLINLIIMNILFKYIKSYIVLLIIAMINVTILYLICKIIFSKYDNYKEINKL